MTKLTEARIETAIVITFLWVVTGIFPIIMAIPMPFPFLILVSLAGGFVGLLALSITFLFGGLVFVLTGKEMG